MVKELLQQSNKKQITTGPLSENTVKKIRQLVENEQSECDISSPMDKLETFFIRIVAAAQEQAQPTSGAVSTTKIGDFLAAESSEEQRRSAILDKLVSVPGPEAFSAEPLKTEKPTTEPTESSAAVKKDILEQLTNHPAPQDEKQAGEGDSEDA
jgi:hypothetical protein